MTPALKALIEAMAAEIVRQTDDQIYRDDDPKMLHIGIYAARYGNGENNGRIDLEKVARAGLASPEFQYELANLRPIGWSDVGTRMGLSMMFDAILKEQP